MIWRPFLLVVALSLIDSANSTYFQRNAARSVGGRDATETITALSPWVTVDTAGIAKTITPSISTIDGAVATLSAPPAYLTRTSIWTLTVDGATTTSTGINPVATVFGPGQAGSFMLCDNTQGVDAPICQPEAGSTLTSGDAYFVTWDPTFFGAENDSIQIEGDYGNGNGFASETLPGSRGFYSWNVTTDILETVGEHNSTLQVSFSIISLDLNDTNVGSRRQGPTVFLGNPEPTELVSPRINTLIVALPSMLGIGILVAAAVIWILNRRRRNMSLIPGWLGGLFKSPTSYRKGQQNPDRANAVSPSLRKLSPHFELQLTNRDSWSATSLGREPHPGRNVFRTEMARQDRERR
ncbi:putative Mid2 domain-containing protein [Seiridium cardinale]|uniref:Mid2 domain-containing protein n=1 Tax=Seiridium cardinale TaxID=138064 RepID=A0ABR2X8F4_9PEZI